MEKKLLINEANVDSDVAHFILNKSKSKSGVLAIVDRKADIHIFAQGVEATVLEANVSLPCEPIPVSIENEKSFYTEKMMQRWAATSRFLPDLDKDLMVNECQLINGGKIIPLEERSSDVSEYTQSSYLRLRHNEESLPLYNYFNPDLNPAFKNFIEGFENEKIAKKRLKRILSQNDRAYAVQKIFSLHS